MLDAIARPFGMLLMFLYSLVGNYGIAIVLVALLIRVILLPFQMKSKRGMIQQASLQPLLKELERKHGSNKNKLQEETMKLYKEEGINPASGCIWSILPLLIMIAFFRVVSQPLTIMMGITAEEYATITALLESMDFTTDFSATHIQIAQVQFISQNLSQFRHISANLKAVDFNFFMNVNFGLTPQWNFLWSPDLELYGSWFAGFLLFLVPLLASGMQFIAAAIGRKMNPFEGANEQMNSMNSMLKFMPLMSVYFCFVTPASLGFYWIISTILQTIQDIVLTKVYSKVIYEEEAIRKIAREKREAELEAKRQETERKKAEGIAERNRNTSKRKRQVNERQEQIEKNVEWTKKNTPIKEAAYEPSRVGNRRYARGRAYDPNRYAGYTDESIVTASGALLSSDVGIDNDDHGTLDTDYTHYSDNVQSEELYDDESIGEDEYEDYDEYEEFQDDKEYEEHEAVEEDDGDSDGSVD